MVKQMLSYISNLQFTLTLTNAYAMFYGDDDAWLNAKAKNCKKVMPRGKVLDRILAREFRRTKLITISEFVPKHRFRIKTASIGDRKLIKNGGWLESE